MEKYNIILLIITVISLIIIVLSLAHSIEKDNCLNMPISKAYKNSFCKKYINDYLGGQQ